MTEDEKAVLVLERVVSDIENSFSLLEVDTKSNRETLVAIHAGISLATILQHAGLLRFIRIIFNAIRIRYRFKDLVNMDD